jgi:ABC-type lipoprotein release transport system permease subunit
MLITEKQRDISTLRAMGASKRRVVSIVTGEGMLLTLSGSILGTLRGVGFALGQLHYGWIKIPGNMILESYPVEINALEIVAINAIMISIGWLISRLTVGAKLKNIM